MFDTVLITGLGLMGGSMAKTIKARTHSRVLGWNRTRRVQSRRWRTARSMPLQPKHCSGKPIFSSSACTRRPQWTGCWSICPS